MEYSLFRQSALQRCRSLWSTKVQTRPITPRRQALAAKAAKCELSSATCDYYDFESLLDA